MMHHGVGRRRAARLFLTRSQRALPTNPASLGALSCRSISSDGAESNRNRVPTTLYRQLLSWCRKYDDVPFNPLPPTTLSPPQVSATALKRLKNMRAFLDANEIKDVAEGDWGDMPRLGWADHPAHYAMYKEDVVVKENMITFPEIRGAGELRAIIRSVYWLNNESTIANVEGEEPSEEKGGGTMDQISLAFEAIKSCNQLSSDLESKRTKRQQSIEVREGERRGSQNEYPSVDYHVGQVVQHQQNGWRGVVVGWTIKDDNTDGRRSSLTTKQYSLADAETIGKGADVSSAAQNAKKLQYTVLVDQNDAQSETMDDDIVFGKSVTLEAQQDLSPVDDANLLRVHNDLISQYFTKFDLRGHFVPNKILSFMYPLDRFSECNYGNDIVYEDVEEGTSDEGLGDEDKSKLLDELNLSTVTILDGVQEIGRRLLVPLSGSNEDDQEKCDESSSLMTTLASSVYTMMKGNKQSTAISSLTELYSLQVRLNALLWTRNANKQHDNDIEFSLGQIVKHKKYGFRGVVVAWDSKPRMDVRHWDGLAHIESPQEKPFYHVHPDMNDCIRSFGGPRHFRYVCQDNLTAHNETQPLELEVPLNPEQWQWDVRTGRYIPSEEMKFMYAEDLGEHETAIVSAVRNLRNILSDSLLEIRGGESNDLFSMDDLFCQLQVAATLEDATIVQDLIKEIFKESPFSDLRDQLDGAIASLLDGRLEEALKAFSDITQSDPLYSEAWNKKATVLYLMGKKDSSLEAAQEALKIEPRQFQALAGIGLIEMEAGNPKAIETFRSCLNVNPWLVMVSSKLFRCLEGSSSKSS